MEMVTCFNTFAKMFWGGYMQNETFFTTFLCPRHSCGKSTVLKVWEVDGTKTFLQMFYFTCNYLLSSTWVQHAKTLAKYVLQHFANVFSVKHFSTSLEAVTCNNYTSKHSYNVFANVLFYM